MFRRMFLSLACVAVLGVAAVGVTGTAHAHGGGCYGQGLGYGGFGYGGYGGFGGGNFVALPAGGYYNAGVRMTGYTPILQPYPAYGYGYPAAYYGSPGVSIRVRF